ncbi:MAG: CHASE3 domain-containing protein [Magnetovibrio sp.]|nr:CHASE3 domain-containing protein [Magnetovibrio sp.]
MQLGIRAKFLISFGLLIIIIISNFGFIVAVENNASKQDQWVMLAHKVIAESDHLLTRLIDTETGQRGFLLTHDDAYLAPYNTGLTETIKSLAALKSLTKNNPTQQFRLNRIEELINKKKDELNDTISLSIQGQKDKALAIVQSDVGKTIMDSLRLHIEEFKAIEHDLLQIRRAQYVKDQDFVYSLFITEALLLIFLIVILGYKIQTSVVTPLIKLASYAKKLGAGEK